MDLKRTAELAGLLFSDKPVIVQEADQARILADYTRHMETVKQRMDTLNQIVHELEQQTNPEAVSSQHLNYGQVGDLVRLTRDLDDILEYLT